MCKGRHFSLLHHFRHRTKHRSRHFNHANYTNPFPAIFTSSIPNISTSGFSKLMQNTRTHLLLLYYTLLLANACRNTYFSRCNLVSRLYVLRSVRNLHHWKGLLLARQFEYKLEVSGQFCTSAEVSLLSGHFGAGLYETLWHHYTLTDFVLFVAD